jgi:hypothetical protein
VALIFTRHARDHMCRDGIAEAWVEAIIAQPEHSGFISQLLGKLKRFSQNHGVHIWIIAHPVRLPRENGKLPVPTLYDISGSAANKADVGLAMHRNSPETKLVGIYVHKVRFKWVGKTVRWISSTTG